MDQNLVRAGAYLSENPLEISADLFLFLISLIARTESSARTDE